MACSLIRSKFLHRKLEFCIKNILKFSGIFLGFFCIRKTHESRYESGSKMLWLWSNLVMLLQLYFLFKTNAVYLRNFKYNSNVAVFLGQILNIITGWTFTFAILFYSFVIFFKKATVIRLINEMIELDSKVSILTQSFEHNLKSMLFIFIKLVFDIVLTIGLTLSLVGVYSQAPLESFIYYEYLIIFPIIILCYCFNITFYYVSYLWIADLLEKVKEELLKMNSANRFNVVQTRHKLLDLSYCVQSIRLVGKNVNQLFEFTLLLFLLEAFIAVVNEVRTINFPFSIYTTEGMKESWVKLVYYNVK